ncbi:hypothetical protein WG66_008192 [Moniliophthora roreri]|nr:hypothetical protein WG66_008192 [Moniliophthora roreri]
MTNASTSARMLEMTGDTELSVLDRTKLTSTGGSGSTSPRGGQGSKTRWTKAHSVSVPITVNSSDSKLVHRRHAGPDQSNTIRVKGRVGAGSKFRPSVPTNSTIRRRDTFASGPGLSSPRLTAGLTPLSTETSRIDEAMMAPRSRMLSDIHIITPSSPTSTSTLSTSELDLSTKKTIRVGGGRGGAGSRLKVSPSSPTSTSTSQISEPMPLTAIKWVVKRKSKSKLKKLDVDSANLHPNLHPLPQVSETHAPNAVESAVTFSPALSVASPALSTESTLPKASVIDIVDDEAPISPISPIIPTSKRRKNKLQSLLLASPTPPPISKTTAQHHHSPSITSLSSTKALGRRILFCRLKRPATAPTPQLEMDNEWWIEDRYDEGPGERDDVSEIIFGERPSTPKPPKAKRKEEVEEEREGNISPLSPPAGEEARTPNTEVEQETPQQCSQKVDSSYASSIHSPTSSVVSATRFRSNDSASSNHSVRSSSQHSTPSDFTRDSSFDAPFTSVGREEQGEGIVVYQRENWVGQWNRSDIGQVLSALRALR